MNSLNNKKRALVLGGVIGALLLGGFAASRFRRAPAPTATVQAPERLVADVGKVGDLVITSEAMELAEIKLTTAGIRTVSEKLAVSGSIEASNDRMVKVTPRVAGKVAAVYAVAGDAVRAGQTLAILESSELAQAQAAYRQAGARVALGGNNLARQRKLANLGVFSQPRAEEARKEVIAAQGEVNATLREVAAAKSGVVEARGDKAALLGEIAAAESEVAAAQSAVAGTKSETAKARSGVVGAESGVAKARSAVAAARSAVADAESDVRRSQSEVMEAQGQVKAQQAAMAQTQTRVKTAESRFNRASELLKEGLVSRQDWEQAKADVEVARADVDAARANIEQAEAQVETARSVQKSAQSRVETAQAQVQAAQADVEAAQAQVEAQRSGVSSTQTQTGSAEAQVQAARAKVRAEQGRLTQADAAIKSAQARQAQVQSRLTSAKERLTLAERTMQREAAVYRGGYGASKEIVEAEAALNQAEIEQQAAAEAVQLLGGRPGGGSTVAMVSPIAGRVQKRDVSPGETLDTEHTAFTVINLGLVWAQLAVTPRDLRYVRMGQIVTLTAESAPGRTFAGRVSAIDNMADEKTRAVRVRVALTNTGEALRPETFVRGYVTTDVRRERVTVPLDALQEHTGKATVYVAKDGSGGFEVRHVQLGVHGEGWREIASGLKAGERIARGGTFYLKSEALKSSLSDGCCAVDKPQEA